MPRFGKRHDCPSSEVLCAHGAGALPPLPGLAAAAHLRSCDFCGAESRLLARSVEPRAATPAPEMPLALRLFAESRLAEMNAVAAYKNLRAA